MAHLDRYRQAIQEVLDHHSRIPYAYGEVTPIVVYDPNRDRYLMLAVGWENRKRVHGCIVHVEIQNGKVWIQQDGTEHGIADELVEKGIPPQDIVLAFHPIELRQYTDFAVA